MHFLYKELLPLNYNLTRKGQITQRLSKGFKKKFFFRFYLFIFRKRGREGPREGEKHQCVVASRTPTTGDLAHNPGMCPDWESNQRP